MYNKILSYHHWLAATVMGVGWYQRDEHIFVQGVILNLVNGIHDTVLMVGGAAIFLYIYSFLTHHFCSGITNNNASRRYLNSGLSIGVGKREKKLSGRRCLFIYFHLLASRQSSRDSATNSVCKPCRPF